MSKELGLSGCKLEIISGSRIRKYSSNKDYNSRILAQIEKQNSFSRHTFTNIDTPKIISEHHEDLVYFDMEYISGCDYYQYFSLASCVNIERIFLFLDEYFKFLIANSHQYKSQIVKGKIKSKLLSLSDSQYSFLFEFVLEHLDKINIDVRKSFCHGDLTVSNILFHPQKVYLIDFLDSYIDTFIVDFVKLKQDLYYHWILKNNDVKNLRIVQCFNSIWNYIESNYRDYVSSDIFYVLELLNFLRIEPYLTTNKQRSILDNIIRSTQLYDEFARSYGRKI